MFAICVDFYYIMFADKFIAGNDEFIQVFNNFLLT